VKISNLTTKLSGPAHNADIYRDTNVYCVQEERAMVGKGKRGIRNVQSEKYEGEKEALKTIFEVGIENKSPSTRGKCEGGFQ
jgi:hypothetical protein